MSVTAQQVSKTGAKGGDIDAIVNEQLQIIDSKILHFSITWGWNVVVHDLPMIFSIPGLDKQNAQRIIYSSVIRSLKKRGFEVRILLETSKSSLYVGWMTDLDVEEVAAMNAIVKDARITTREIDDFMTKGKTAAPKAASVAKPGPPLSVAGAQTVMQPRGGTMSTAATPSNAEAELLAAVAPTSI